MTERRVANIKRKGEIAFCGICGTSTSYALSLSLSSTMIIIMFWYHIYYSRGDFRFNLNSAYSYPANALNDQIASARYYMVWDYLYCRVGAGIHYASIRDGGLLHEGSPRWRGDAWRNFFGSDTLLVLVMLALVFLIIFPPISTWLPSLM